jgi:hypothetical protein
LYVPKQIRRLGILQLVLGLFLFIVMGAISLSLAPSLIAGAAGRKEGFTGTPEQARLIMGLFAAIVALGLTSSISGIWQTITARRNIWIMLLSFVVIAVLLVLVWTVSISLQVPKP